MKALKQKLVLLAVSITLVGSSIYAYRTLNPVQEPEQALPSEGTDTLEQDTSLDLVDSSQLTKLVDIEITKDNSVTLLGQVDLESVTQAIQDLKKKAQEEDELFLIITSPGGSVFAGAMLLETIQGSKTPINTICVGMCASMGAQIHAVGKKRYMTDKSVLMFHPASGGVQGEMETVQSRVNFIMNYVNKMDAFVAERAQISLVDLKAMVRSELWLDARQATERKFNDAIVYIIDKRGASSLSQFLPQGEEESSKSGKGKKRPSLGEDRFFNLQ